jgi:hypothetical protein
MVENIGSDLSDWDKLEALLSLGIVETRKAGFWFLVDSGMFDYDGTLEEPEGC